MTSVELIHFVYVTSLLYIFYHSATAPQWAKASSLPRIHDHAVTEPSFLPWLDYSAPHLVRNIGNMRYVDRPASLFSGEHVSSQEI